MPASKPKYTAELNGLMRQLSKLHQEIRELDPGSEILPENRDRRVKELSHEVAELSKQNTELRGHSYRQRKELARLNRAWNTCAFFMWAVKKCSSDARYAQALRRLDGIAKGKDENGTPT